MAATDQDPAPISTHNAFVSVFAPRSCSGDYPYLQTVPQGRLADGSQAEIQEKNDLRLQVFILPFFQVNFQPSAARSTKSSLEALPDTTAFPLPAAPQEQSSLGKKNGEAVLRILTQENSHQR